MDQFGRKATMLCLTVPLLLGWLLISFAKNIPMIYGGRILTGKSRISSEYNSSKL